MVETCFSGFRDTELDTSTIFVSRRISLVENSSQGKGLHIYFVSGRIYFVSGHIHFVSLHIYFVSGQNQQPHKKIEFSLVFHRGEHRTHVNIYRTHD